MSHGMIPREVIERVKERIDIVELVSGYVTLTRAGQNLKALCPFHAEKTPSFTVSPSRQMFHCFGCGVGGNALTFLMKIEGGTFPETVRELAQRAGIEIQTVEAPPSSDRAIRDRLVQLNQRAALWFRHNLAHPQHGKQARDYLEHRGIQPITVETFGLGLALGEWDALLTAMSREGFTPADLAAGGLAVAKEQARRPTDRSGYYDRFRERLMFPIRDLQSRVIAFGGRILNDGLPKYLNSSDTPLFHKGRTLYAMDRAREAASRLGSLIIVEGYFDAIALHQAGIHNTVATLGTALTPEHVNAIRRYVPRVTLMFDPDAAGVRAALRTLDLFVDSGVAVRVVSLPSGEDPDTFVRGHGPDAFQGLQESAPSLLDFTVERSLQTAQSGVIEDRIRSVDEILRVLHKGSHRIEKEECIRRVAERLGINEQRLIERYPELLSTSPRTSRASAKLHPTAPSADRRFHGNPEERDLVQLLLHGHLTPVQLRALDPPSFALPACRRIIEIALTHVGADGRVRLRSLLDQAAEDPLCASLASELSLAELHCEDVQQHVTGCLERLERKRREHVLGELIVKLRIAEREGRAEEAQRLNERVNELRSSKAAVAASTARGDSRVPN
jgi:DNA primase